MTRIEREQLIGRYLSGEMSSAEEQEFFIQVAVDKELRHDLKAHRIIDSAIRKDRDAQAIGHTALRMRVAAMLPGALPEAAPNPGSHIPNPAAPPTQAPLLPAAAGNAGSMLGAASMKWLVGSIAAMLLTVGAIMTLPRLDPAVVETAPQGAPGATRENGAPAIIADPRSETPRVAPPAQSPPGTATKPAAEAVTQESPSVEEMPVRRSAGRAATTNRRSGSHDSRSDAAAATTDRNDVGASDAKPRPAQASPATHPGAAEPAKADSQRNETIDIGVKIEIPKK